MPKAAEQPQPKKRKVNIKAAVEKATETSKKAASSARKKLRSLQDHISTRKAISAAETVGGGVAGGVAAGLGLDIEWGEYVIPVSLPAGAALLGVGVMAESEDLEALGLGALTFGAGRAAEMVTAKLAS